MSENVQSRSRTLAKLGASILLAGALLAGVLLPVVGGTGLVARNSASLLDALPVELTDKTPAGNSRVLAADGQLITNLYTHNRTPVTPDQIAPVMKQALVDIEDARFYDHNGLDVQGTMRALVKNAVAGSVQEGGSTLTQQLVKQTLLQTATSPEERQAAKEQTVGRKLREARLALALEDTYDKDEILTRYLNAVYFGKGAYGIQAAAQKYFSVNAIDLTLPQAAMLAGLVQSPFYDDPISNPENAVTRRNQVLKRMSDLGHISNQELVEISAQPVEVTPGQDPPNGCIDATIGGFFCAYVYSYLTGTLGLSENDIKNGGWTIQTTLRPDMQAAGDQAVLNTLALGDELIGTYTAVEPGTGHVLAMANNRRYGCDEDECESVNLNVVPSRGAGSTFKVFTAAAALEEGFTKNYTRTTSDPYTSKVFKGPCKGRSTPTSLYCVPNAGRGYPATLDMEKALYMSSNTYFLALEDALGSVEAPVRMAERMGMSFDAPNQTPADQIIAEKRGSFTFGTDAVSPLNLASAFSTLAASGTRCDPTPITGILDRSGKPLKNDKGQPVYAGDSCATAAVPAGVANTLNQILRKDVEPGHRGQTASRAYIPGHQIAGKTGTTNKNTSVAFVGYTPQLAASVLVWNSSGDFSVGGFGGGKGATIWHDAMAPILTGAPMVPFPPEDAAVAEGDSRAVPACATVDECEAALDAAGLQHAVRAVDSDQPAGTFLGTTPAAGTRSPTAQPVTIQVSKGRAEGQQPAPAPADPPPGDDDDDDD